MQNGRYGTKIVEDLHRYLTTSSRPLYGGDVKRSLSILENLFQSQIIKQSDDEQRFAEALKFAQVAIENDWVEKICLSTDFFFSTWVLLLIFLWRRKITTRGRICYW